MTSETRAPTAEIVLEQVERILKSPDFDASERNGRFLIYAVNETLAGRADRIKAYTIATSVFGRGDNFDPQQDAIVRIEAGRLRRSLERYYLTSGQNDPVRIAIPTGSYVPAFTVQEPLTEGDTPKAAIPGTAHPNKRFHRPTVLVAAFEEEGDQSAFPSFSRGFTRDLIVGLTRFTDLFVLGPETSSHFGPDLDLARLRDAHDIDFVVTGGTFMHGRRFRVEAVLIDTQSGQYLWADSIERTLDPETIMSVRDDVACYVTRAIAQPYGVIFNARAREIEGKQPAYLSSFDYVTQFYQYRRSFEIDQLDALHTGLEQAITADTHYAEAFACLSLLYSDSVRYGHPLGSDVNPLDRALALAHRAIELAPNFCRGHLAMSVALWFSGDPAGGIASLETGLALNPNDTELGAELGFRHAMRGEWDKGVPLIEQSYRRNPGQQGSFRVGLSLWHFAHGRYAQALAEARNINAPKVLYGHVMIAVSAAKLGLTAEADAAIRTILSLGPDYGTRIVADLGNRNLAPELIEVIVPVVYEAGLPRPGAPKRTDATTMSERTRAKGHDQRRAAI